MLVLRRVREQRLGQQREFFWAGSHRQLHCPMRGAGLVQLWNLQLRVNLSREKSRRTQRCRA